MGSLLDNSIQVISRSSKNSLFVRLWPAKNTPKGIVYIVHDLGGHCLLYDVIAAYFYDDGYTVASHDHHGHGLSSGTRLHTSSYQSYTEDVMQCLEEVRFQNPDTENVILLGHGVGALLAAIISTKLPDVIKRVVLHNPVFKIKEEDKTSAHMCWYISYVLPYMYSPFGGKDASLLITDQKQLQKYTHDPFVWHEGARLSVLHAIQSAMADFETDPSVFSCPTLLQIGTDSPLIDHSDIDDKSAKHENVKVVCYENAKHFLHMETPDTVKQVLQDMMTFCKEDEIAS